MGEPSASFSFGSVCSGIEAASVAWKPLGWRPAFVSEIDKAASAVLAHHYPDTPNLGDMTKWEDWPDADLDVLVGGTPCQSFSVPGLRKGLDDPRGSLMLTFGAIARRYRPKWLVWENVPGVLSSDGGRDFGAFLGMLGLLGYGFAYRVLGAQYFGLAQRRARVFVVGYLGDWRPPAAVLFERESLSGNPAPRREAGKGTAHELAPSLTGSGRGVERPGESRGQDPVVELARCVTAGEGKRQDYETTTIVTHALRGEGFDASEDGTGRGTPLVAFSCKDHGADAGEIAPTLRAMGHDGSHANAGGQIAIAIQGAATRENPNSGPDGIGVRTDDCAFTLEARSEVQAVAFNHQAGGSKAMLGFSRELGQTVQRSQEQAIMRGSAVRRLTPRECERLQGFPDDYTLIPYRGRMMADGPRYKMLGNSMAVPVMRWIGERIEAVASLSQEPTP